MSGVSTQVDEPGLATQPCSIYTLPSTPTQYDLEIGYTTRGAQLVACDAARQLAVDTHEEEHRLNAKLAQARAEANKPWWHFWSVRVASPDNKK